MDTSTYFVSDSGQTKIETSLDNLPILKNQEISETTEWTN